MSDFFSIDPRDPDYDLELVDMVSIGRAMQWEEMQEHLHAND